MIVGIGVDLVDLSRIERMLGKHPERFPAKICRPGEVQRRQGAARNQHIGGLFAAKEAVMKALGTGWDQGVAFRQIEIRRDGPGGPKVVLHGEAKAVADRLSVRNIHLSITHEHDRAMAFVILETNP